MAKVVIFGTGRGADVAFRYIASDSHHEVCGFTVDEKYLSSRKFNQLPVVEFENVTDVFPTEDYKMFVPLGWENMNKLRFNKYMEAKNKGYKFISYVYSKIPRIEEIQVGENCFILENQSINLDVKIGDNVVMWSGNQIGDSTQIMDHSWISSHVCIAGNVIIKPFCIIGINATVTHNITVEEECFIGANALINCNTSPKGVYVVEGTSKAKFSSDKFMAILKRTK
jgi:sugar O-acyltransferase (sialic acid O-acetyltransferase NeuD family)